jgi:UDP-3-O-[3-hydroxymyristoyl] glucosamine N-acyltransferase
MADPRFYDNRGPFPLKALRACAEFALPEGIDDSALVHDVAGLAQAGPAHLSFYEGSRARTDFLGTKAGYCLVGAKTAGATRLPATAILACGSVARAFGAIARAFYPEHELDIRKQDAAVHPTARLDEGVVLAPGVVIGPHAEIGARTRIGAHSVIGRGVAIGGGCEIGAHVSIAFAYLGDAVILQSGVAIGGSGFGFASGADGHVKTPQLGRVIVQDRVEVGANSTIDRGALGDTVIGEGSKIDNLVQIGHNTRMGRHCIVAGQAGISGSVVLGDYVIVGGKVGIADHVTIGERARLAGLAGVTHDLEGGRDYGGIPARPIRVWHRETVALSKLARANKRSGDE